jgi:hypothetical protein
MDCKNARKFIVLDHYGELDPAEKARLAEHLKTCQTCATEREDTKRVFALIDATARPDVVLSDPDRAWQAIHSAIGRERAPALRPSLYGRRWALAGASLMLVLVAGIFIGRTWFAPRLKPEATAQAAVTGPSFQPILASYFDSLRPVLIDYTNSADSAPAGGAVVVDAGVIQRLQLDNALLKRRLAGKDRVAAELLDDIDLILREISHQETPGAASPAAIRDLIRQRDVLFKMNIIKTL